MNRISKIFNYFFIGFSYLTSKKLIAVLIIILFVSILKVSFGYKEELMVKEEELMLIENDVIFEKGNPNINYYNQEVEQINYGDGMAITNYFKCYQESVNIEGLPDNILGYINKLKELFDENEKYYSFYYEDLFSGFTVSYNEEAPIFTASSIKGPAMIYL